MFDESIFSWKKARLLIRLEIAGSNDEWTSFRGKLPPPYFGNYRVLTFYKAFMIARLWLYL